MYDIETLLILVGMISIAASVPVFIIGGALFGVVVAPIAGALFLTGFISACLSTIFAV